MTESPVHVYTPESAVRAPRRLLREMTRDLLASRELAWRLFVRDFSAHYRQSVLGYVWAFLPPLFTTLTFVVLSRNGVINVGLTTIPYPAYVMIGTLLWAVFAEAVASPMRTVSAAKAMLAKINFPREALLLAGLLDVLFNFLVRLALLAAVFAYYGIVPPATAPLALLGVFALCSLGFMFGLLLTPLGLLYTDVGQSLGVALSLWMLITPVVYAPPSAGLLSRVGAFNPVSPLVVTSRELLTTGHPGQWLSAACVFGGTLVLLFAGWIVFRLAMPIVIERLGS